MAITAAMVKELRETTGVGMLDCKKALAETHGDMEKAIEYLREKALLLQLKKLDVLLLKVLYILSLQTAIKKALL